ncbi:MAG: primosomal protein N' [bacterium]|nr:primosomal protein N' [bacterium]
MSASSLKEPYAAVAVPLPIPKALDYLVPPSMDQRALPGVRVRVPVGRRKVTGVVVERHARDPAEAGIKLKPLTAAIDLAPILPAELTHLAAFVSEYYLAPIGEVYRALLPSGLEAWGSQRVWLSDRGALASRARDGLEEKVLEALRPGGRMSLAELEAACGGAAIHEAVERLRERGWLSVSESRRTGTRYVTAVELAQGTLEELLERCGRSKPGRAVVEWLANAGRPALRSELEAELEVSPGVVRRLIKLGVLRSFTQIARLELDEHRTEPGRKNSFVLRPDQAEAVESLTTALAEGRFRPFLLHGMTGSGKTEVYLRAVERVLAGDGSAILLVPEIALVPVLAQALRERFGKHAAILHSALSAPERQQEWHRIRSGEARLVLGPRSAIFAPVRNLELVVVDEEHDSAYKQGSTPRYNARDVALWRGREAEATVALVSATPSLESRLNAEREKLSPLLLTERVGIGELPESVLVDLRESTEIRRPGTVHFSPRLLTEMEEAFTAGDQAILLRNRRGYSPVLLCRACGDDLRCDDCGLPRTFHKRFDELQCHYCGSRRSVPETCPSCGESALEPMGTGTERVEEEFRERFPEVPAAVLDRDTVRRRGGVTNVLDRFGRGETQVLIGTQMVAKGHHFPGVALAAVLQADAYLSFPDFRAVERTYNLLIQLGGPAGRGDRKGKFLIQTYHPDHYAIQSVLTHDDRAFREEEMRFRRIFHYPPYTRMVQLLVRDSHRERAAQTAERVAHELGRRAPGVGERGAEIRVIGPAPAAFERLRGKWRFQILVRGPSASRVRRLVQASLPERATSEIVVDVDPMELL